MNALEYLTGLLLSELGDQPLLSGLIAFAVVASPASWQYIFGNCSGAIQVRQWNEMLCNDLHIKKQARSISTIAAMVIPVVDTPLPIGCSEINWKTPFARLSALCGCFGFIWIIRLPSSLAFAYLVWVSEAIAATFFAVADAHRFDMLQTRTPNSFSLMLWIRCIAPARSFPFPIRVFFVVALVVLSHVIRIVGAADFASSTTAGFTPRPRSVLVAIVWHELVNWLRVVTRAIRIRTRFELRLFYDRIYHSFATPLAEGRWRLHPRERRFDFHQFTSNQGVALCQP